MTKKLQTYINRLVKINNQTTYNLKGLSARNIQLLHLRDEGYTYDYIGKILGISRQRVHRIEQDILISQKYKTKRAIIEKIVREIYDFGSKQPSKQPSKITHNLKKDDKNKTKKSRTKQNPHSISFRLR